MAGRNTKLTPETHQLIIQALSVGATHRLACEYAGIDETTMCLWIVKGKAGKAPYSEFYEAVKKADGRAAVGWLAKIEAAANEGNWQASAWKLERRYPHEYGKTVQEQTGKDGGPIIIKVVYEDAPEDPAP